MVKLSRVVAGAVVFALLPAAGTATAVRRRERPLPVSSAALTQDGPDLVWQVVLSRPFSPGALARDHRSLCLLLERQRSATAAGQVCLSGRHLLYMRITASGAGPARSVPATITRKSSSELAASFLPADAGLDYRPLRWQVLSRVNPPACAPSGACVTLFPATPARLALHTPRLTGCVTGRGPEWVFNGPPTTRDIALTFDDGPDSMPPTADFVNLLARERVPATFFEIGRQIGEYDPHGTVERRMLAAGDMIGDHSWDHPDLTRLSGSAQRSELARTAAAIRRATGFTPCLFRAPYGAVNPGLLRVARSLGMSTIQWDVDPRDWSEPGVGAIYANVVSHAHNGAIVIQHVGGGPRYQTLAALPREIAALRARGYAFVTISAMLGDKLIYK